MNEGHSHGRRTTFLILAGILLLVLLLCASCRYNGPLSSLFPTPTFNKTWVPYPTQEIDGCYIDEDGRLMSRFGDDYARYAFWLDDGKLGVTGLSQSYGFYGNMLEYYFCYTEVTEPGLITEFDGTARFASNVSNIESLLAPYVDLDEIAAAAYSEEYQTIIYQQRNATYYLDWHDSTQWDMFYPQYDLWEIDLTTETKNYILPRSASYRVFQPELVSWIDESNVYMGKDLNSEPMFPTFVDLQAEREQFFQDLCFYDSAVNQIHLSPVRNQVLLAIGRGVWLFNLENFDDLRSSGDRHSCYDREEFAAMLEKGTELFTHEPSTHRAASHQWFYQWGEQSGDIYYIDINYIDLHHKYEIELSLVRYNIEEDTTELVISAEEISAIYPEDENNLRFTVSSDEKYVAFYTNWSSKAIYVVEINP